VISDLWVANSIENSSRGFFKCATLFTNILGIALVTKRDLKKVALLVFSYSIAVIVLPGWLTRSNEFSALSDVAQWKLGFASAASSLVASGSVFLMPSSWLFQILSFGGVGILQIILDVRSLAAVNLLCASVIGGKGATLIRGVVGRLAIVAIFLLGAGIVLFVMYGRTSRDYSERREDSNTWRFASLFAAFSAIESSPIIGHGSWANSASALDERDTIIRSRGRSRDVADNVFYVHSQLFQAWYEGGILGIAFPVVFGLLLLSAWWRVFVILPRSRYTGMNMFVLTTAVWSLFFSPFNGAHRIEITLAAAVIVGLEARRSKAEDMADVGTIRWASAAAPTIADGPMVLITHNRVRGIYRSRNRVQE
jgi:O-antigen ligase